MDSETIVNESVKAICDADITLRDLDGILSEETCRRLRASVDKVQALYNHGILEIKQTKSSTEVTIKREKGFTRAEAHQLISLLHAFCGSCGLKDKQNNKKCICVYARAQDVTGSIHIDHDKAIRTSSECWLAFKDTVSQALEKKASGKKGGSVARGTEKDASEKSAANDKSIKNAMNKQKFDLSTSASREVLMFEVRILTRVSDALLRPLTNALPESEDDDEMDVDDTAQAPTEKEIRQTISPAGGSAHEEAAIRTFDMIEYPSDESGGKWKPLENFSQSQTVLQRSDIVFSLPKGGQRPANYDPRLMSVPENARDMLFDFVHCINLPMEQSYSLETLQHYKHLPWHGKDNVIQSLCPAASVTVPVGIITPRATMDLMQLARCITIHQSDNCAAVDIVEDAVRTFQEQNQKLLARSGMWPGQHKPVMESCIELFQECSAAVMPNFKFCNSSQYIGTEMIQRSGCGYRGGDDIFGYLNEEGKEDFRFFLVRFAKAPSPNRLNSYTLVMIRSFISDRNVSTHAEGEKWKAARLDTTVAITQILEIFIQACIGLKDMGDRGLVHNSAGLDHMLLYPKLNYVAEHMQGEEIDGVTKELVDVIKKGEKRYLDCPIYPGYIGHRHIRPKMVPHAHPFTARRSSSVLKSKGETSCSKDKPEECPKCTSTGHLPIPPLTYVPPEILNFYNARNTSETFTFVDDASAVFAFGLSIIDLLSAVIGIPRDPDYVSRTPTTNVYQKILERNIFLPSWFASTIDDATKAVGQAVAEQRELFKFYSKGDLYGLMSRMYKDAGAPTGTVWRYNFKDAILARAIMAKVRDNTEVTENKWVKLNDIPEKFVSEITATAYVSVVRALNAMLDCVEPLRQASEMFENDAPEDQTAANFFKEFQTDNQRFLNPACLVHIALGLEKIDMTEEISQHFKKGFLDLADTLTSLHGNLLRLFLFANECCQPKPEKRPQLQAVISELTSILDAVEALKTTP